MAAHTLWRRLHGRTAADVPRWAVLAAYAIPLVVLPSGLWRIAAMIFNAPLLEVDTTPSGGDLEGLAGGWWYILLLSVVSEAAAFLAVGLVSEWGEAWPRWIPVLGGRRVPVMAAVIPAGLGALALLIFPYAMIMISFGMKINGDPGGMVTHGWQTVIFNVTYWPLAAWSPLLALVTVHYYRRRTTSPRDLAVESRRQDGPATVGGVTRRGRGR
ncbi:hypothetical protein ABT294_02965 [Nonomuraea sp. NPDC000554]|uniref:hypothetical protein n=1 Tax=Nonomuraea sp. NPDC000554 TaxID=3154259 RepID=UPI00332E6FBB